MLLVLPLQIFYYFIIIFIFRLGHPNFEMLNHDVVEPLFIEGKILSC